MNDSVDVSTLRKVCFLGVVPTHCSGNRLMVVIG